MHTGHANNDFSVTVVSGVLPMPATCAIGPIFDEPTKELRTVGLLYLYDYYTLFIDSVLDLVAYALCPSQITLTKICTEFK